MNHKFRTSSKGTGHRSHSRTVLTKREGQCLTRVAGCRETGAQMASRTGVEVTVQGTVAGAVSVAVPSTAPKGSEKDTRRVPEKGDLGQSRTKIS